MPRPIDSFFQQAQSAFDSGNTEYALILCKDILRTHPDYLQARQLLRKAQPLHVFKYQTLGSCILAFCQILCLFIRKPRLQCFVAEESLSYAPNNLWALRTIAKASKKLKDWQTIVFTLESMQGHTGEKLNDKIDLCHAYLETGQTEKAIKQSEWILKENPDCFEALTLIRKASVSQALTNQRTLNSPFIQSPKSPVVKETSAHLV